MTPPFPTLFSPRKVGPRTVKNRICCSAHAEAMAVDGMPAERTVRYYELKARGGVGFIMCWTPNANRRRDEYGGLLAHPMRFGVAVLRAVRERVGSDFLVGVCMTGDDFHAGGLDNRACQEIAGRPTSWG